MFNKRKKIGLLPYTREDLYGHSTTSPQIMGWEMHKFNVPSLWSQSSGENVVVAVIDTGCDIDHEDLKNNVLDGKNFVENNTTPMDKAGHGTHVSSTIAACNNGYGMVGLAPNAKILPIKALGNDGHGDMTKIIDAILWAADTNADIITMSLGSAGSSVPLHKAIQYAASKNKFVFCAAGNSGEDSDIMFPAAYDEVVAIGAIDENLQRTNFTCSGPELDFLAPGDRILGCVPGNRYALMSGTSMSNPFAVGCLALLISFYKKQGRSNLSLNDYISYFKAGCKPLSDTKYHDKKYQGYGIIIPSLPT